MSYMSFEEFVALSKASGKHWFDKSAMHYWGSSISRGTWCPSTGLFISLEFTGLDRKGRAYTIRRGNTMTGAVDTVGRFGAYETYDAARSALAALKA